VHEQTQPTHDVAHSHAATVTAVLLHRACTVSVTLQELIKQLAPISQLASNKPSLEGHCPCNQAIYKALSCSACRCVDTGSATKGCQGVSSKQWELGVLTRKYNQRMPGNQQ
jgi:hypothetical protein